MLTSLFRRNRTQTQPDGTQILMRFLTSGGAQVHVSFIGISTQHTFSSSPHGQRDHAWTCHGCNTQTDRLHHLTLDQVRQDANQHATTCRAMPDTTTA